MPLAWTATRLSNSFSIRAGIIFIRLRVWKVPAGIIFVRLRVWKVPAGIIFIRLRVWMPFAGTATRPSNSLDGKCRNCNTTFEEFGQQVPELQHDLRSVSKRSAGMIFNCPTVWLLSAECRDDYWQCVFSSLTSQSAWSEKEYINFNYDQVWDYALDLKNFHKPSRTALLVPILVATEAHNLEFQFLETSHVDKLIWLSA